MDASMICVSVCKGSCRSGWWRTLSCGLVTEGIGFFYHRPLHWNLVDRGGLPLLHVSHAVRFTSTGSAAVRRRERKLQYSRRGRHSAAHAGKQTR